MTRDGDWVTKSDIKQYEICPYTYWLLFSGQITREELFGEVGELLVSRGIEFEENLLEEMPVMPEKLGIEAMSGIAEFLFNVPTSTNAVRRIAGRPDGIELATQAPVEIKRHHQIKPMDRLELAFYWMLLEGERHDQSIAPYGWICRPQVPQPTHVKLKPRDFAKVEYLIEAVRRARREGVTPRVCYCRVCYKRPEVTALFKNLDDVRLIWGIGSQNARSLAEAGVTTLRTLVDADIDSISIRLTSVTGRRFPTATVAEWRHHARALVEGRSIRFAHEPIALERYIVLDLEYDVMIPGGIWLIGVHVVDNMCETIQLWCDSRRAVTHSLKKLQALLAKYPELPVVTWNGTAADLPQIKYALTPSLAPLADELSKRHLDLYHVIRKSIRFPTTSLSLKAIADHIGAKRVSKIADGMEALALYNRYVFSRSLNAKQRYKKQLLAYNLSDLVAIPALIDHCDQLPLDSTG